MNYAKIIRKEIFDGIDDTLYVCLLQAGERAAVEMDIIGMIIKREISRYTDDAVRRAKESLTEGGESNDS